MRDFLLRIARLAKRTPIHTHLLSIFPILSLYTANYPDFSRTDFVRPLIAAVLLASLLLIAGRGLRCGWSGAGFVASVSILVFASYGHIYGVVEDLTVGDFAIGRHRFLVPLSIAVLSGSVVAVLQSGHRRLEALTGLANVLALTLVIFQLGWLAFQVQAGVGNLTESRNGPVVELNIPAFEEDLPDIYYLILDGYGRQDILRELYGLDNSAFINWLEQRGFYVADSSNANYLHTDLSLASSLNMDYIHALQGQYGFSLNQIPVGQLIGDSQVRRLLENLGYSIVSFETSFWPTDFSDSDVYIQVGQESRFPWVFLTGQPNRFEGLYLQTTMWRVVSDYYLQSGNQSAYETSYEQERERVRSIARTLTEIPTWPGEYFVFAHIISPHPPFIFDRHGAPTNPGYPYNLADHGDSLEFATRQEYMAGYVEQVLHINELAMEAIDQILEQSSTPPIIILQGDHGPGAYYQKDSLSATYLPERASILNAYLLPPEAQASLYPSITPVNSFRIIFRDVFGSRMPLKEDLTFFQIEEAVPVP
jgi:hypothetical protein